MDKPSAPVRVQLKRTKGWKMPPNTVKVDRSTKWGNPFTAAGCRDAGYVGSDEAINARCVEAFRAWLGPSWRINWDGPEAEATRDRILKSIPELRGKNLACWCKLPEPGEPDICHAAVLLEIANA